MHEAAKSEFRSRADVRSTLLIENDSTTLRYGLVMCVLVDVVATALPVCCIPTHKRTHTVEIVKIFLTRIVAESNRMKRRTIFAPNDYKLLPSYGRIQCGMLRNVSFGVRAYQTE